MRSVAIVLLALGIAAAAVLADGSPTDRRALVMLRILAYDKHLSERAHDSIKFLIVHRRDDDGGACAARWGEAFDKIKKVKIDGRSVQIMVHGFDKPADLDHALKDLDVTALIACEGLPVPELAKLTRAHKVLSFAMREDDVVAGLSVAIVPGKDPDKPRDEIVVNPRAAAAEGVKFDAGLMQLARAVGAQ